MEKIDFVQMNSDKIEEMERKIHKIPTKIKSDARLIYQRFMEHPIVGSRAFKTTYGGCLFLSCHYNRKPLKQKEVAKIVGTNEGSLRKCLQLAATHLEYYVPLRSI